MTGSKTTGIFSIHIDIDESLKGDNMEKIALWKMLRKKDTFRNLYTNHVNYAYRTNASYTLFDKVHPDVPMDLTPYNQIQLSKFFYANEMMKEYSQVLYLDFDVVPVSWEKFPFQEGLSIRNMWQGPRAEAVNMMLKGGMKPWSTVVKLAMVDMLGKYENDTLNIFNTGVMGFVNVDLDLDYSEEIECLLNPDIQWWPDELLRYNITVNNEAMFTHKILVKNNVPVNYLASKWNYLVDWKDSFRTIQCEPEEAYFNHYIRKNFPWKIT